MPPPISRRRRPFSCNNATAGCCSAAVALFAITSLCSSNYLMCDGFTPITTTNNHYCNTNDNNNCNTIINNRLSSSTTLYIYAPPGSGYVRSDIIDEDDPSYIEPTTHSELTTSDIEQISPPIYPSTYEPMLEYPGTMRPGRTPENMPYHDLPNLNINDPDPVPWPHFQEIEWHHKWDPPHEQALAMEEFIEEQGRWASVEEEAEMRMGMRRGVRERRELEEGGGGKGGVGNEQMVIMDDEDEDDDEDSESSSTKNIGIGLGEGVEALLQSTVTDSSEGSEEVDDDDDEEEDEGEDDFLLELGLDDDDDEEEEGVDDDDDDDDDDDE